MLSSVVLLLNSPRLFSFLLLMLSGLVPVAVALVYVLTIDSGDVYDEGWGVRGGGWEEVDDLNFDRRVGVCRQLSSLDGGRNNADVCTSGMMVLVRGSIVTALWGGTLMWS